MSIPKPSQFCIKTVPILSHGTIKCTSKEEILKKRPFICIIAILSGGAAVSIYKVYYAQYFSEQFSLSTLYKACFRGVKLHGSAMTPYNDRHKSKER